MSYKNEKKPTLKLQLESEPVEFEQSDKTNPISMPILPHSTPKYNGFVASMLLSGSNNATTGTELVRLLKLSSLRELTQLVERDRRNGVPICASVDNRNPGYYIADNADELEAYIKSLDRRIKNVSITRSYCMRTLGEMRR